VREPKWGWTSPHNWKRRAEDHESLNPRGKTLEKNEGNQSGGLVKHKQKSGIKGGGGGQSPGGRGKTSVTRGPIPWERGLRVPGSQANWV